MERRPVEREVPIERHLAIVWRVPQFVALDRIDFDRVARGVELDILVAADIDGRAAGNVDMTGGHRKCGKAGGQ
ncbi:hypothetical protein D9M73_112530 [compost metagenome]